MILQQIYSGNHLYQISSESPEFYTRLICFASVLFYTYALISQNIMTSHFSGHSVYMTQLEASVCLPLQVAEAKQQHDEPNG